MVSMKDIARKCGVSVATVSKALNGNPGISEETRQRICSFAEEMGYMANSAARALKTNRTYNLGILFADEKRSGLGHEYFSAMLESLKDEAEKHGYDITFINSNVAGKPLSYVQHCRYRGVDGVIVACVDFTDPRVVELAESDIPLVTIDHIYPHRNAILSDNINGVDCLVRHAVQMGHRRIAFLHGEDSTVAKERLAGFWLACHDLGIPVRPEYLISCVYHDPRRCEEATRQLISLPNPPTCVLFPDDFSFVGGYHVLADAGFSIPADISVMGYDGIHLARVMRLTTYSQNADRIGRTAVDRLIRLIEDPDNTPAEHILVHGELLPGVTVRQL